MKFAGCLLLVSGWVIVLVALVLLPGLGARSAFIVAGIAVEIVGLALIAREQVMEQRREQELQQSIRGQGRGAAFGSYR